MRNSNKRNLIYEIVSSSYDHPTAEQVHKIAREVIPSISLSTVYRNLNELSEKKLIKKVIIAQDSDRFDSTLQSHSHLFCVTCKNVYDVKGISLEHLINDVEEINNVQIFSNEISFEGICSNCQKNK